MIKVANSAKDKVFSLMKDEGYDPFKDYVRVGVKSGGCSGLSYDLKFDRSHELEDKIYEDNNIKIIVDKIGIPIKFKIINPIKILGP